MNDPIPFFHDGLWHVFYQHNPSHAWWGDMHWAHAVSNDLLHWTQAPIAIAPNRMPAGHREAFDRDGVWTGCVVRAGDSFRAYYTAISTLEPLTQHQAIAVSDDLYAWRKPGTPVLLASAPDDFGPTWRDPHVWRDAGEWWMLIGSGRTDGSAAVALLYRSQDGLAWRYAGVAAEIASEIAGHDMECPDLFPLNAEEHLLLTGHGKSYWHAGRWDGLSFVRHRTALLCVGDYYAAKTAIDDAGRRVIFGWIRDTRPRDDAVRAGWSGLLAFPTEVGVHPDGTPRFRPAAELAGTRVRTLEPETGDAAHFDAASRSVELDVTFVTTDDDAAIRVVIDDATATERMLEIRRSGGQWTALDQPMLLESNEVSVRVLIDGPVVETWIAERVMGCWMCPSPVLQRGATIRVQSAGGTLSARCYEHAARR